MITSFYFYLKSGFGFINSVKIAFHIHPLEILFNIVLIIAVTALLIFSFNCILEGLEYENKKRTEYIYNLEKTLAKCLTPGDHPIVLEDGQVILCGAVNAGRHKENKYGNE